LGINERQPYIRDVPSKHQSQESYDRDRVPLTGTTGLFYIQLAEPGCAFDCQLDRREFRCGPWVAPPSDSSQLCRTTVVGVSAHRPWNDVYTGLAQQVGSDSQNSSSVHGDRKRSALNSFGVFVGAGRMGLVGHSTGSRCRDASTLHPGPAKGPRSRVDLASLFSADHRLGRSSVFDRRVVDGRLGCLCEGRRGMAHDVVRQFAIASIRKTPAPDERRFHEQLVRRDPDVRGRLAQQPSRIPGLRSTRHRMASVRHELDHDPHTQAPRLGDKDQGGYRD